uniref:Ribonuclease H-like domain-containing protein n=1 Tax=Tanacetum cinerariifolium TaxID=118510 RepID=A0A6L2N5I2_TANCI|nr:ribonuclease H-like domain-containing protein [Tanacetum cinerariifolium]
MKVYQDQFDTLLSKLDITESHAISMFLAGMNTDIAMMVSMFKPRNLTDICCVANLQEATNESRTKSKPMYTGYKNIVSNSSGSYRGSNVSTSNNKPLLALPTPKQTFNSGRKQLNLQKARQLGCKLKATCPLQIIVAGGNQLGSNQQLQTEIQELLTEFEDVFIVPKCLPPNKSLDYNIPLKEGVIAVNIRPYRQLNKQTIKDKFPNPVIKELIGELYGEKKGVLKWTEEATLAFKDLQQAMMLISTDSNELIDPVKSTWVTDSKLKSVIKGLQQGLLHGSKYTWSAKELIMKGKLVVGNEEAVRLQLIAHFHSSVVGGHLGVSTKDANQKFLRSLPSSWSQVSLIMRTKPGNVAFVSSDSTSSTNEVSTTYGVSTSSGHNSQREGSSSYTDELMRPTKHDEPKAMVTIDGEGVEWTGYAKDDIENYALMAFNSNNLGSDTEVTSCSKECEKTYAKLKKLYDEQMKQLGDASIEIQAYTLALKKVEAQLVCHQKNQLAYEEKIRFMKIDLDDKTNLLIYHKKLLAEAEKEKEELKTKHKIFQSSSKGLSKLLNSQMSAKDKSKLGYGTQIHEGVLNYENEVLENVFDSRSSDVEDSHVNDRFPKVEGMHVVPPLMTGIYMPPKSDFGIDESKFTYGPKQYKNSESDAKTSDLASCESNSSVETLESVPKLVESKPKYAPIIEEYKSKNDDEYVFKAIVEQEIPSCAFINTVKHDNPHQTLKGKGIINSGCSRHMTWNKAYLIEYQDFNGGPVTFGGSKCQITEMFDKKNKVLFIDTECLVLSLDFKLPDKNQVLFRVHRQNNMYSFNLENIVPFGGLACLIAKATVDESNKWHRRFRWVFFLGTKDETSGILKDFIRQIKNQLNQKVKTIRCDNGTEFKNIDIIELYASKGIKREYSNARTSQQNGVTEKKNRTFIEPVTTENKANKTAGLKEANNSTGTQDNIDAGNSKMEAEHVQEYFVLPLWSFYTSTEKRSEAKNGDQKLNGDTVNTASPLRDVSAARPSYPDLLTYANQDDSQVPSLEDIYEIPNDGIFTSASYDAEGAVADFTNLESTVNVNKPKKISQALEDESWVNAMQDELLQFKTQQVWILVDLPFGKKVIRTK